MRVNHCYSALVIAAGLIGCIATSAFAQDVPPCRKGEAQPVCIQKFGQVSVQLESPDGHSIKRAIIFSDNMKRDAQDFTLAAGFLMMVLNPASTPDQRRELLDSMVTARRDVKVWSGYVWQLAHSDTSEAIRIIAERGAPAAQAASECYGPDRTQMYCGPDRCKLAQAKFAQRHAEAQFALNWKDTIWRESPRSDRAYQATEKLADALALRKTARQEAEAICGR